ncbi:TPM domain-containing protein [Paenibacillus sp. TH7-28]
MKKRFWLITICLLSSFCLTVPVQAIKAAAVAGYKTLIYDDAHLLSQADYDELNAMANEYGAERETDIMIITTDNPENEDVVKITEDFYDEQAPGYDKAHGDAVILTVDMRNRDIYLAGFYKAEQYLGDGRLDKIRDKITPDLTEGDYRQAFEQYIKTANRYMGYEPGVNPDNILFNLWVQLGGALAIGGIAVGIMAYRSGGRVTVSGRTYEDAGASGVLQRQDRFIRTTVTKRKIQKSSSSGGGGGGGRTGGGHSHSGSRGSF